MKKIDWNVWSQAGTRSVPFENDGTSVASGVWDEWHGIFMIGIVLYGGFNG